MQHAALAGGARMLLQRLEVPRVLRAAGNEAADPETAYIPASAEDNLARFKQEAPVWIDHSHDKVERSKNMVAVAQQALSLQQESERLAQNQLAQGVVLMSERRQAMAATYKAHADFLQANLGSYLAWAELQETVGLTETRSLMREFFAEDWERDT